VRRRKIRPPHKDCRNVNPKTSILIPSCAVQNGTEAIELWLEPVL
jgi:hypothetical protein